MDDKSARGEVVAGWLI